MFLKYVGIIFLDVLMIDLWRLLVKALTIFSTCLVLDNAMCALFVKDFIKTHTALNNAVCIQGSLGSTITAEISDGLWRRIHDWFKQQTFRKHTNMLSWIQEVAKKHKYMIHTLSNKIHEHNSTVWGPIFTQCLQILFETVLLTSNLF